MVSVRTIGLSALMALALPGEAQAQRAAAPPEQPVVTREYTPLSAERLDQMVPKHPGQLGALAPDNLRKARPKAPFDLTGTWFIDLHEGFLHFLFGPPYPKFHAEGVQALVDAAAAQKAGKTYRDVIGQCWPPGMPMIMTRVWPHAFIQLPTAIYMISGFNNSVRTIFMDGRAHTDPDLVVPSYNGESIGHWEGQTLVVDTRFFETENHYIDYGIPIDDDFAMTERIRLLDGGKTMEIAYTMTDPGMWDGEWKSTKRFNRADYTDINESHCILQYNEHLPGTELGSETAKERGQTEIEGKPGAVKRAIALCALVVAAPAVAHHSFAMFDQKKVVTLEGTVTQFQWTNPHSFIELDVPGARGAAVHWSIELNSPNNLKRQGWSRNSLKPGDKATVRLNPLRSGEHGGLFLDVRLANGRTLDSGMPKDGTPVNVPRA